MRKLMWFSIGFAGACGIGAYCYSSWLVYLAIPALLIGLVMVFLRHTWTLWRQLLCATLGLAVGFVCFFGFHQWYLQAAYELDGRQMILTAEASDYSHSDGKGSRVSARAFLSEKSYRVVLYLKDNPELKPGDRIRGVFRLRMTHEGLEGNTYHRGDGVYLLGYATGSSNYTVYNEIPLRHYPAMIRRVITACLDETFPNDVSFFAKALLLGDRTDLDYETNTAFKTSGISHIISVSGLHVSILFSVIFLASGRKRVLTAILGIPVLFLFAAVAGFTPSITRACIMQTIMIIALLINREYDPPTALSAAALIMLSINPMVITSASFQLSVGCMAGIFLFSGRIQAWIVNFSVWNQWKGIKVRLRHWVASGVAVSVSSMFFTTPLLAYYFGAVSLVGMLTNLLTLWVVNWIFYGITLVCILSLIWQPAGIAVAWVISWPVRYVLTTAKLLSSFPLAAVYTKSIYVVLWLILCYLLVVIFLLSKKRNPYVLICCSLLGLSVALLCSWTEPLLSSTKMTVLDVGQGQCILLQGQGKNFLVDCGGERDTEAADLAAETLLSMGVFKLDGIILTHYDGDHSAGIAMLLSRVSADAVYLPRETENTVMRQEVVAATSGKGFYVEEDIVLSWKESSMHIYAPISDVSENERGLCILFRGVKCDILITGDVGVQTENRLILEKNIPKLTALVAGHHGSKYSTGAALLTGTSPEYVFISVGEDNTYGHPSQEVLDRLGEYGCQVYRTDRDGTIVFRR